MVHKVGAVSNLEMYEVSCEPNKLLTKLCNRVCDSPYFALYYIVGYTQPFAILRLVMNQWNIPNIPNTLIL